MNIFIYFILISLLPMWAQYKLKSTYSKYSKVASTSGKTGKQVAEEIMHANGIYDVEVVQGQGLLSDHYNPSTNQVVLSPHNYSTPSVAATAVAAHEVGHVIQDKVADYKPMRLRAMLVPLANLGSNLSWMAITVGMFLTYMNSYLGHYALWAGVIFMAFAVMFQIVTLPVEFDASKRALQQVEALNIVEEKEYRHCKKVLTAAALTYVAGAAVALIELFRFILMANSSSRD